MPRLNWRWLLAISSVPSFAQVLLYSLVPESPRYQCIKGYTSDARQTLEKMALLNQRKLPPGLLVSNGINRQDEESTPSKLTPLLSSNSKTFTGSTSGFSTFFMLFSPNLIRITLLLWMLYFGNVFSYYGIILLTSKLSSGQSGCSSTKNLDSQNFQDTSLYVNTFITSLAELPGLLLAAILVDRVGRRLSTAIMFVLGCIFLFPLVTTQSAALTTGLLFGARMFAIGTFTVASIYCPELYPTAVRATGAGTASSIGRIGGIVAPLVAVGLVSGCHQAAAIVLFETAMVAAAVCALMFPYDTKGRELSDTINSTSKQAVVVG